MQEGSAAWRAGVRDGDLLDSFVQDYVQKLTPASYARWDANTLARYNGMGSRAVAVLRIMPAAGSLPQEFPFSSRLGATRAIRVRARAACVSTA